MAKKATTTEEVNNYPMEDFQDMLVLFQHPGNFRDEQKVKIHHYLKKYVDPNHPRPIDGCNCPLGWGASFNKLRDWASRNGGLFK